MRVLYVLVALSIFCGSLLTVADGNAALCHEYLPSSIKQMVEDSYKSWHVASTSVLNQSDRERFKPFIKNECYGLIRGNFRAWAQAMRYICFGHKGTVTWTS